MQYKKVITFFLIALPISIVLRILQIRNIVDSKTGFFLPEFVFFGYFILGIIFLVGIMFVVFSFISHRSPDQAPSGNIFLSISSFIAAIGVLAKAFLSHSSFSIQSLLLFISAIITAAFFIAFALKSFFEFELPSFTFLFPCIYFTFDIIREFTVISSLAIISDNILLLAALCSLMIFALQFAKLYNNVDREYNFRKLLASGLLSTLFCFVQSIPYFLFRIFSSVQNSHISLASNICLFCIGCFVITFISSHFSRKNACIK